MCIIKTSEAVIIQPYVRTVQAQTPKTTKRYLLLLQPVSKIITYPESMVLQKYISQLLLAQPEVPSKGT